VARPQTHRPPRGTGVQGVADQIWKAHTLQFSLLQQGAEHGSRRGGNAPLASVGQETHPDERGSAARSSCVSMGGRLRWTERLGRLACEFGRRATNPATPTACLEEEKRTGDERRGRYRVAVRANEWEERRSLLERLCEQGSKVGGQGLAQRRKSEAVTDQLARDPLFRRLNPNDFPGHRERLLGRVKRHLESRAGR